MLSTLFDEFFLQPVSTKSAMTSKNSPKYNYYVKDGVLYYEFNVAGYKREDLEVFYDGRLLVVKTKKDYSTDSVKNLYDYYVYGIQLLPFYWQTQVNNYFIDSKVFCDLEDGLLKISLVREKPELQTVNLLNQQESLPQA